LFFRTRGKEVLKVLARPDWMSIFERSKGCARIVPGIEPTAPVRPRVKDWWMSMLCLGGVIDGVVDGGIVDGGRVNRK
jgi:hypothetical protein